MKIYLYIKSNEIKIDLKSVVHPKFILNNCNKKDKIIIKNSQIGRNIKVGYGTKIFNSTLGGCIKVGNYTTIMDNCRFISLINTIEIGNFCSIAPNVTIQESYHRMDKITTYSVEKNLINKNSLNDIYSKGNIIIEDDVWIGINTVILSGVRIGRGAVIGAGSVVTRDVEPYDIVGGNPAKLLRKRFKKEQIDMLENLEWWKWDKKEILEKRNLFEKEIVND